MVKWYLSKYEPLFAFFKETLSSNAFLKFLIGSGLVFLKLFTFALSYKVPTAKIGQLSTDREVHG